MLHCMPCLARPGDVLTWMRKYAPHTGGYGVGVRARPRRGWIAGTEAHQEDVLRMGRCRYVEVVYVVLSGEYLRSLLGQSFGAEVLYLSRWDAAVVSPLHYDASRISNRLR
jgi:hypothetical protein